MAIAGAVALLAGAWVWATGEVAGRLNAGTWPEVPAGAVAGIVVRLPARWPMPAAAWPASARPQLPSTAALVVVALGLAVVAGGMAAVLVVGGGGLARRWRSRFGGATGTGVAGAGSTLGARLGPRRPLDGGGARWASGRDLALLTVGGGGGGRLVLGRVGRRLIATEARHSLLVLGPTQSGKTTGLAIPAILEWEGPVVATSVKADLAGATEAWRRAAGPCWVFDPTGSTPSPSRAGWSPLSASTTWSDAQRMASWLVEAAPSRQGMGDGAFWFSAAAKLLGPLLLAAAIAGRDMGSVVTWNDLGDCDEPLDILTEAGEVASTTALEACAARDERLRSSVTTTLETVLTPFADPVVAAATSRNDLDLDRLVGGDGTLFLCGPSHEQQRVQGLFAGLVATVVAAAVERVHRSGRPLDPPLLLVLDEAANIAPLRDLDTLASTAAGLGIQLVTVCQDLAQLATRYGPERSKTIANNHRAKLVLSGIADLSTLDLVSGLAGETAVREASETADLRDGRQTRTTSLAYRRLLPTDALRTITPGTGVLVYGHLPAARVELRPWYRDRGLTARVGSGQ